MGGTTQPAADGQRSPETDDLAHRSHALMSAVIGRILAVQHGEGADHGLRLFAEGLPAILGRLSALERATRHTVYNMHRNIPFDPLRREREPNRRTRFRKLRGHLITQPVQHVSLIAACHPDTWVAPVQVQGLAIDERVALFPGPLSPAGRPTVWLCTDPDLVMAFCELWERTKRQAVPIHDAPGLVRLTERQVDVIALLSRGTKDTTIAQLLGVSPRTVTTEVGKVLDAFGVATRWEAGVIIGQACPPSLKVPMSNPPGRGAGSPPRTRG